MRSGKILIKKANVPDGSFARYSVKDVLVEGSRIAAAGKTLKAPAGAETIDASGCFLLPGFCDAHTHLGQTFGRGLIENKNITEWLKYIWRYKLSAEEIYLSALCGSAEAIKTGTTSVSEMLGETPTNAAAVATAITDSGLRAVLSRGVVDVRENEFTPTVKPALAVARSREFIEEWDGKGRGRISARIAPIGLPACSKLLLKSLADLSAETGAGLHAHACEGKTETAKMRRKYGKGEIEVLYDCGILGKNTQLAHVIWVSDREINLLAKTGTNVVTCPSSNAKLADGMLPVKKMADKGINIAVGCDGAASSNSYDMVKEGRALSLMHKNFNLDASLLPTGEIYKMLTVNGAVAMGIDNAGIIAPGAAADLVLYRADSLLVMPEENFLTNLMHTGSGLEADTVIVDGEIIYKNGKFVFIDEEALVREAGKIIKKLVRLYE